MTEVRDLAERACFAVCLALGRLLRSARYSNVRFVVLDGGWQVRKSRGFYAPLLIWMSRPLVRILDVGVQVLRLTEWQERERRLYWRLRGTSIQIGSDGVLVLPRLPGKTLAELLEDSQVEEPVRKRAVERAVVALAEFHRLGFTHGDAMAANVLVDLEAGVARWFDFETIHESTRPMVWRRADDVRALLVTCVARTAPGTRAGMLRLILDVYADEAVTRVLATSFTSVFRRPLPFHLAQAGVSFECFREIARLLNERLAEQPGRTRPDNVNDVSHTQRTRGPADKGLGAKGLSRRSQLRFVGRMRAGLARAARSSMKASRYAVEAAARSVAALQRR